MVETNASISIPKTPQELEQAIQKYRNSDLSGNELFYQWLAIRTAVLQQQDQTPENDVPGDDSY